MSNYSIIDSPWNTIAHIDCFRTQGIKTIIRYYDAELFTPYPQRRLGPVEAIKLSQNGFKIMVVFEVSENIVASTGTAFGLDALQCAKEIGQPNESAIYFAVDFNAELTIIKEQIIPYFQAIQKVMNDARPTQSYKIGAYGSGLVINTLKKENLIDYRWLSHSPDYLGTKEALEDGSYELRQISPSTIICRLRTYYNELNPTISDVRSIGAFQVDSQAN